MFADFAGVRFLQLAPMVACNCRASELAGWLYMYACVWGWGMGSWSWERSVFARVDIGMKIGWERPQKASNNS